MSASTTSTRRARAVEPPANPLPGRFDAWVAFVVCVGLAIYWTSGVSDARAWGWDESMHAELPAARMLVALRGGDFGEAHRALLDCQQYPFVWPLVLLAVQAVTGISEHACRVAGTVAWCTALFGLFLLGRELGARIEPRLKGARWLAWALFAFGALSPLALAFSGTLFLEVPFACAAVWTLRAWVRRDGTATRELAAGEWMTVALFTKFNYGLLLWAGLGVAWYLEGFQERARLGKFVGRSLVLAFVPLLACLWWFVLARGGEHCAALLAFLKGNQAFAPTSYGIRVRDATLFLHLGPIVCASVLVLALVALARLRSMQVRVLVLVALAFVIPSWMHPFHLDRFLIPQAIPIWALAAVGFACAGLYLRIALVLILGVGCAGFERVWFLEQLGMKSDKPELVEYQCGILESWRDLSGARSLPTSGLDREAYDALVAGIVKAAGPKERVSWIGMSNEFSPAALHLSRLQAGMDPALFLAEAPRKLDLDYFGPGPAANDLNALRALALASDLVLFSRPQDLRARTGREALVQQIEALQIGLGWQAREIARAQVARPLKPPLEVSLFACRPPPK